jgi:hypothetical protein
MTAKQKHARYGFTVSVKLLIGQITFRQKTPSMHCQKFTQTGLKPYFIFKRQGEKFNMKTDILLSGFLMKGTLTGPFCSKINLMYFGYDLLRRNILCRNRTRTHAGGMVRGIKTAPLGH